MTMTKKILCPGSGKQVDATKVRTGLGTDAWARCPECDRVLKPTGTGLFRQHQPRGRTTATLDRTRDILWEMVEPEDPILGGRLHASKAFAAAHPPPNGRDDFENLSDLLADLMHWTDDPARSFEDYSYDRDDVFDNALDSARRHHSAEKAEQPKENTA